MGFDPRLGPPSIVFNFTIDISGDDQVSSQSHDLSGWNTFVIETPASLDSTNINFQAADSKAGTYDDVVDAGGTAVAVTCASSAQQITVDGQAAAMFMAAAGHMKLKMGSAESADRAIKIRASQ